MAKHQVRYHWTPKNFLLLFFLLLAICLLVRTVWQMWDKRLYADQQATATAKRVIELQARQRFLTDKNQQLETARGVEEEIRSNFSVAKQGERVITIVETPGEKQLPTTTSSTANRLSSWWYWLEEHF